MIKLPDAITADHAPEVDEIYMAVDGMGLKGSYAAYAAGFNAAIEKVQRLNATAQPVSAPEWTNEQCLEFLSIAFRHANISGDIEMDDIRLGIRMVNAAAPGGQDG
ncbi:hypothetical protein [Pantoea ananatis]|uniref:hypothetical protein n=1 Tax=Pantoea ananas TaxID=553 RepID=UPI001B31785E|nr:hypothetical protein [Pantoea ananatis]